MRGEQNPSDELLSEANKNLYRSQLPDVISYIVSDQEWRTVIREFMTTALPKLGNDAAREIYGQLEIALADSRNFDAVMDVLKQATLQVQTQTSSPADIKASILNQLTQMKIENNNKINAAVDMSHHNQQLYKFLDNYSPRSADPATNTGFKNQKASLIELFSQEITADNRTATLQQWQTAVNNLKQNNEVDIKKRNQLIDALQAHIEFVKNIPVESLAIYNVLRDARQRVPQQQIKEMDKIIRNGDLYASNDGIADRLKTALSVVITPSNTTTAPHNNATAASITAMNEAPKVLITPPRNTAPRQHSTNNIFQKLYENIKRKLPDGIKTFHLFSKPETELPKMPNEIVQIAPKKMPASDQPEPVKENQNDTAPRRRNP